MSKSIEQLRKQRHRLNDREQKVERLIRGEQLDIERLSDEITEEREHQEELIDRRVEILDALREENRADRRGEGERTEVWEERRALRLDELADMVDASEGRILRLIERKATSREERRELKRRDRKLERRLHVVEQRIEAKKDKAGLLTPDFHVAEFDCNDGTRIVDFCPYIIPDLKHLCVAHLQPRRDAGGSISINSGLRHYRYNLSIGGAEFSYHRYEYRKRAPAADHIQVGSPASEVQRWYDSHTNPDGMGYYAGFTHIDERGYRSRWSGAA